MIKQRYGGMKIFLHPEKIKNLLIGKVTAPIYVRFKPTNKCNHNCFFCSYDPKNGDIEVRDLMIDRSAEMVTEKALEILTDFKKMDVKSITFSGGGEPLIHPGITAMLEKVQNDGIDYSIITNGQKLKGRAAEILTNANWVRVSSDACSEEAMKKIRGLSREEFRELTNNLYNFGKNKDLGCEFGINYVVHHKNADIVYKSVRHFKNLGANHIKITPRWITNFEEYHAPTKDSVLEQIARAREDFQEEGGFQVHDTYSGDFFGVSVAKRNTSRCYWAQINPVVGADLNVYMCHDKAYASSGILGSLKNQSFKDLWFSEEAAKIFQAFNPIEKCQHHCANDKKNIMIQEVLDCCGPDVNFV